MSNFGENFDEKLEVIEIGGKAGTRDGEKRSEDYFKIILFVEGKSKI